MNKDLLYDWNLDDIYGNSVYVLENKLIFEIENGSCVIDLNTGMLIDKFSSRYNVSYYIERYNELRKNLSLNWTPQDLYEACYYDRNRNTLNKK